MNSNIIIRKAFPCELKVLKEIMYNEEIIRREALGFDYGRAFLIYKYIFLLDYIIKPFFKKSIMFFLLEKDGKIIGGLRCLINWNERITNLGFVSIKKTHRNQGMGSLLISKVLDYMKLKGINKVLLTVDADNTNAIHTYIKNGFIIYKEKILVTRFRSCKFVYIISINKLLFNDKTSILSCNDIVGSNRPAIRILMMERELG
jgi:GNAT superfamily N-acetyltransferase